MVSRDLRPASLAFVMVAAALAACGGSGAPTETPPPPPPPPPPPVAPVQVGTIPNQTVETGQTTTLDVVSYFRDPDGGALTYTAASSAAGVVSVSLSGSTLTMVGVADGTATVTVTARDPDGLTAAQSFSVTVVTPNRAPEAVGTIPGQDLQPGRTATLGVTSYFRDPDGDALTYTVASSAPAVVSVAMSGSTLTMVGVADGSGTVTVTARDPDGLTATQSFSVTVVTPNRAPEALGTVADRTLQVGETVALDLSPYFTDADGDALSYEAASSAPAVVSVSLSGSTLTMVGVGDGTGTVTATARDPDGLTATQVSSVTVVPRAPDLTFAGVSPATATVAPGGSVTIEFRIENRGLIAAGATIIRAMRSSNPTVSPADTELRSWSFSSLAPSKERTVPVTISVDRGSAPGTIYIGMCADPVANESNARNNCSAGVRLTITGSSNRLESAVGERTVRIRVVRPERIAASGVTLVRNDPT